MKIGEKNYIQQLQLHNEKALMYVIDEYGGLIMAIIRKHLFRRGEYRRHRTHTQREGMQVRRRAVALGAGRRRRGGHRRRRMWT